MLPAIELLLDGMPDGPRFGTEQVKWDLAFQKKHRIRFERSKLTKRTQRRLKKTTRTVCNVLGIDGYARLDFRLSPKGKLYFLEANPNPDIAEGDEFASAAEAKGLNYHHLLQRILKLARARSRAAVRSLDGTSGVE